MRQGIASTFTLLVIAFMIFSVSIYLEPALNNDEGGDPTIKMASAGRLVWQKYNCQSCHQLYGLGGYLGPDLTNVYSAEGKGDAFIRAMLTSGTTQMPQFTLSEEEQNELIAFLKTTDKSGSADPRDFKILNSGMIEANR